MTTHVEKSRSLRNEVGVAAIQSLDHDGCFGYSFLKKNGHGVILVSYRRVDIRNIKEYEKNFVYIND